MEQEEEWASEAELAKALAAIVDGCNALHIDLLLIGAFAVRAYVESFRRLTTDLDFVAPRHAQNGIAALFKSLGYEFSAQTRFGGVQAWKYLGDAKLQVDIAVDEVIDMSTGAVYHVPTETFEQKVRASVVPLEGGTGVAAYAIPLADLLVLKLMTVRPQDTADALSLLLEGPSGETIALFKRRARQAGLAVQINRNLAVLVRSSDRSYQQIMSNYTGGNLTGNQIKTLRRLLRQLQL